MNKAEFNKYIQKVIIKHMKTGKVSMNCNADQANAIIDIFLDGVLLGLEEQDEISLVGFGRFYKRKMQSRQGRNPKTGETLNIPAHVQLKFFVGTKLKEACNPKPKQPLKKAKKTAL